MINIIGEDTSMSKLEKLQYAKTEIEKGRPREEVAKELGYATYRSLDNAFRLEGYHFDRKRGIYISQDNTKKPGVGDEVRTTQGDEVISLFTTGKFNAKQIAEKVGFESARSLALYMTSKGYQWDAERNNYVFDNALEKEGMEEEQTRVITPPIASSTLGGSILTYLEQNEHVLKRLIEKAKGDDKPQGIPRYGIPGIFVTKSVHMSNQLDQMVRDFSSEKNIAQKDIFEVALLHFFQDYGYEREVQSLLERA
ncbi:hypothetical protein [Salipaludibacillus sp. CF4.18]|uniref:hypothetical protein n=1 Tax=Salipaludibacillus sp. CF4.18 TaxID=3373081 RepID=UPI003EE7D228